MVDVRKRREFRAWLGTQPRETSIAIAARAALRLLPALAMEYGTRDRLKPEFSKLSAEVTLPVFRAAALPWVVATNPAQGKELRAYAAHIAAAAYAVANPAVYAAVAAADAAYAAANAANTVYIDAAANAGYSAVAAADLVHVASDVVFIDSGGAPQSLIASPLWGEGTPEWAQKHWRRLRDILAAENQGWDVWIRWYEAVLEGRSTPGGEELDIYRVTLESEDDWQKGPAHVNALIRKKEKEIAGRSNSLPSGLSRTTVLELAQLASPQPILSLDGKLDASPNSKFDVPTLDLDLPTLPIRQLRIVDVILSDLPAQAPRHLRPSLQYYGEELKSRGTQPILGILKDMAEIVIAACAANEDEWLAAGMRKGFDIFIANHDLLMQHFPLDMERERRYAEIEVDEDAITGTDFSQPFKEVEELVKSSDNVTPNAKLVIERMREIAEVTAYTLPSGRSYLDPREVVPDPQRRLPSISVKKRLILQARGFWEGALPIMKLVGLGIDCSDKLRKLWDLFNKFFSG